jgi:hypothetical protein
LTPAELRALDDGLNTGVQKPPGDQSPATHGRSRIEIPPLPLSRQWSKGKRSSAARSSRPKPAIAAFFVSHDPALAVDVTEALHKELAQDGISVEIRGRSEPFLLIKAPDEEMLRHYLEMSRNLTEEIISDKTVTSTGVYLEPPDAPEKSLRISLTPRGSHGARPALLPEHDEFTSPEERTRQRCAHLDLSSRRLVLALKRVGRAHTGAVPHVELGRYVLNKYPTNKSLTFGELSDIVGHHLHKGRFNAEMGDIQEAREILQGMKREVSCFSGASFAIGSSSAVTPNFVFEACSNQHRVEATLESCEDEAVRREAASTSFGNVRVFKILDHNSGGGELDMAVLRLGR